MATELELLGSLDSSCPGDVLNYQCTVGSRGLTWVLPGTGNLEQGLYWGFSTNRSSGGFQWWLISYDVTCSNCFTSILTFGARVGAVGCKNETEREGVYRSIALRGIYIAIQQNDSAEHDISLKISAYDYKYFKIKIIGI